MAVKKSALGAVLGPAPAVAEAHRALSPGRTAVLDRLTAHRGGFGVAELATETGLHPNTVREHLEALVRAGLAERTRGQAVGRGRPAWVYTAMPDQTFGRSAREYAGLALALAEALAETSADPAADATLAGQTWGRQLAGAPTGRLTAVAARRRVVEVFETLGFAPRPDAAARVVRLTRCPLLEAARHYPDVVCSVHLGLARGILAALGAPTKGGKVDPFAAPGICRLHLPTPEAART